MGVDRYSEYLTTVGEREEINRHDASLCAQERLYMFSVSGVKQTSDQFLNKNETLTAMPTLRATLN